MSTETLLLILLMIFLIGVFPAWPYSLAWGYTPTGILVVILAVVLVWMIVGGKEVRSPGGDIESGAREVGEDIKELGQDVKDSVRDTVN